MKIFIQAQKNGQPKGINCFTADQGFREMGFIPEYFSTLEELTDCSPNDLIVGGIGCVRGQLKRFGIELPSIDYPDELTPFLGRRIWKSTITELLADFSKRPVFVKPVREKLFTGMVLRTESDCPKLSYCEKNEPVICSEVIDFQREWRVFVKYGKVIDVRPYFGDWACQFDAAIIDEAVKTYRSGPAGYAIDFGVTEDGRTLLVEVNDGYSLGCYGLAPLDYARLLSARWTELVGIHDECDVFFESFEWRNPSK